MTAKNASPWIYAGIAGGTIDTVDVAVAPAAGAGLRNFCSGIQYHNTAAVASEIVIKNGATVIWRGYVPASMTFPASFEFDPPLPSSANTALNVALLTTATATRLSAQGFIDA